MLNVTAEFASSALDIPEDMVVHPCRWRRCQHGSNSTRCGLYCFNPLYLPPALIGHLQKWVEDFPCKYLPVQHQVKTLLESRRVRAMRKLNGGQLCVSVCVCVHVWWGLWLYFPFSCPLRRWHGLYCNSTLISYDAAVTADLSLRAENRPVNQLRTHYRGNGG